MEWVVRAPILTVVVGLFAPGINPMPENVPIDKRESHQFAAIFSTSGKIFLQKTMDSVKLQVVLETKFHIGIICIK